MKRAIAATVLLPVVLSIHLSCGNSDDEQGISTPGTPSVIFPLQVGNAWTYQRTSYDTQGSIVARDTLTERVVRDTLIYGERWYIWETVSGLSLGTLRSDGYWTLVGYETALWLRYPASLNDTYTITETGPTIHVLALDTLIAAPYGTIPCIAYEQLSSRDGVRARIDYCAANIGLVRTDEFVHTSGGQDSLARRLDLIELHLH